MRKIISILMVALVWCTLTLTPAMADEDSNAAIAQYRIRIAFIYNFLKFVEWPSGVRQPGKSPAVCIVGDENFSNYFTRFEQVHGKGGFALNIYDTVSGSALASCQVLFIGADAKASVPSILSYVRGRPVLSISEVPGFAHEGGVIEMVTVGTSIGLFSQDKMKLRINLRAAQADGLSIDARLLQIAAEVIK